MGKFNKQVPETKLADHKRVCRKCHLISYHWICCGERTARYQEARGAVHFIVKEGSGKQ